MTSLFACCWHILAAQSPIRYPDKAGIPETPAPAVPPVDTLNQVPQILQTIDWFVAAAGVLISAIFLLIVLPRTRSAARLKVVPPRSNRFGEDSILIVVLAYLLPAAAMAWALSPTNPGSPIWRALAVDTIARIAGIAACAVMASSQFDGGVAAFLLSPAQMRFARAAALFVGTTLVAMGVCPLIQDWGIWAFQQFAPQFAPVAHPTLERLAKGQPTWMIAWLWISAGLIAPVAEEVFFRGVLQSALVNMMRSRWLAIATASAAFGAVHFPQPQAVIPLVFMGMVLGYLYERTGSLAAPIAVHVLFNVKTLIWHQLSQAQV